ncbi:MAG: sulfide/dihydroorotate dehydrogenase-like FAD/NAD-binding protein, partial [Anaerolineae bacterium]
MYRITAKEVLAPVTKLFKVHAPEVARKAKAGQFVIVRVDEKGERIPLTIADYDRESGEITIVFQEVGKTTKQLGMMDVGDELASFTGPLGRPTEIEHYGTVICVGGGVGIAPIYPIARALREASNTIISIIGARNKELLFWEEKMRSVSDELIVCTDDGSYARKALVTEPLKEVLESGRKIDIVWAIGPAIMMKFCSLTTKPFGVKTIVSLNSIMVDGTGMCGACRVEVGGKTRFVCVDGPEFDGH